jgi:hypothetical protein
VTNPYPVFEDAIENFTRVPNERRDVDARSLEHARPTLGVLAYLRDDFSDANLDSYGNHVAETESRERSAPAKLLGIRWFPPPNAVANPVLVCRPAIHRVNDKRMGIGSRPACISNGELASLVYCIIIAT